MERPKSPFKKEQFTNVLSTVQLTITSRKLNKGFNKIKSRLQQTCNSIINGQSCRSKLT